MVISWSYDIHLIIIWWSYNYYDGQLLIIWISCVENRMTFWWISVDYLREVIALRKKLNFPVWGGPITLWIDEILPPHLCSVCFITFMDSSKANLVLEKFDKKLGFGQTPPLFGPKDQIFPFFFFRLPLPHFPKKIQLWGNFQKTGLCLKQWANPSTPKDLGKLTTNLIRMAWYAILSILKQIFTKKFRTFDPHPPTV